MTLFVRYFAGLATLLGRDEETLPLADAAPVTVGHALDRLIERFKVGHVPLILRTIFDGLGAGLLDRSRHPLVLLFATAGLAGPPQLMRRVIGDRLPLPGALAPEALAHELVDALFNGVGARKGA